MKQEIKKDGRGKHGNQGRKATGRKRTLKLSAKFTHLERDEIIKKANDLNLTQADFLIKAAEKF